jgi:exonuclease III
MERLEIRHPIATPTPVHHYYRNICKAPIRIGTWNVRSCNDNNFPFIAQDLHSMNLDVCLLQETRIRGKVTVATPAGVSVKGKASVGEGTFIVYASGLEEMQRHGVGIAVTRKLSGSVGNVRRISERLMALDLKTRPVTVTIVCAYAPTSAYSEEEREDFITLLNQTIAAVPKSNYLIVGGDFNVQVAPLEGVCGKYTVTDELTEAAAPLLSLLDEQGLVVLNTFFKPKKTGRLFTYESALGRTQIDFLMVRRRFITSAQNCKVIRRTLHDSDHNLLTAKLQVHMKVNQKRQERKQPLNLASLSQKCTRIAFRQELAARVERSRCQEIARTHTHGDRSVNERWADAKNDILAAARKALPKPAHKRFPWMSDETVALAVTYREKRLTRASQADVRAARSAYRASLRKDETQRWVRYAEKLEAAHARNDQRTLYKEIRSFNRKCAVPVSAEALAQSFRSALTSDRADQDFEAVLPRSPSPTPAPTRSDIAAAMKRLKSGKATGPDDIPVELLRAGGDKVLDLLEPIIRQFWECGILPQDLGSADVVPIFKGGNPDDAQRYRPIALLNTAFKIIEQLLLVHIAPFVKTDSEQCGFVKGKSTIDAILSLRLIAQERAEKQLPFWMCALDFTSAFDSVSRSLVWRELIAAGANAHHVDLCARLFDAVSYRVRTTTSTSENYTSTRGCPQGSTLGPHLFLVAMQSVMAAVRQEAGELGLNVAGAKLFYLAYADDVILLAEDSDRLQRLIESTCRHASQSGLTVNVEKTVLLTTEAGPSGIIRVNGVPLAPSATLNYLGSIVDGAGNSSVDIGNRIRRAFAAGRQLFRRCFGQRGLPVGLRARVYKSTIQPILTYAGETWTALEADLRRLDVYERSGLRRFLPKRLMTYPSGRVGPKMISNTEVYRKTGLSPCSEKVAEKRWRYIHRVCLAPREIVPHGCIEYEEVGRRRRGGQSLTWHRKVATEVKSLGRAAGWNGSWSWCKRSAVRAEQATWVSQFFHASK